jgi:hypothetical protein
MIWNPEKNNVTRTGSVLLLRLKLESSYPVGPVRKIRFSASFEIFTVMTVHIAVF